MPDTSPPRIFRVRYTIKRRPRDERGRFRDRTVVAWIKVPIGHLPELSRLLAEALLSHEIESFSLQAARPGEITAEVREQLERWGVIAEREDQRVPVRWTA